MKRSLTLVALFAALVAAGVLLFPGANDAKERGGKASLKRGEYLVRYGGCGDCHTPMTMDKELGMPVPDMTRMLSGHPAGAPDPVSTLAPGDQGIISATFTAFRMPFGVVYAKNITSDRETGIGSWTEAQFVRTMRTGKHLGIAGPVLPPMPWMNSAVLTDEDLKAMYAYLQSVPAIRNAVPGNKVQAEAVQAIGAAYEKMRASQTVVPAAGKPVKD